MYNNPYNPQPNPFAGLPQYDPYARLQQLEAPMQQPPRPLEISFVGGVEGAKAHPLPNGSTTILMDNADPIFYMVQVDPQGMRNISPYKFEAIELKQRDKVDVSAFATKEDIQALHESLNSVMEQLEQLKQPIPTSVANQKGGKNNGQSTV